MLCWSIYITSITLWVQPTNATVQGKKKLFNRFTLPSVYCALCSVYCTEMFSTKILDRSSINGFYVMVQLHSWASLLLKVTSVKR